MTKRELDKIVDFWIPTLGLEHWSIHTKIEEFSPASHAAECQRTVCYDTAVIRFQKWLMRNEPPDKVIWKLTSDGQISDKEIEITIVHELLHCKCATLDRTIKVANPALKKKQYAMLVESFEDGEETFVDSLARSLVENVGLHA